MDYNFSQILLKGYILDNEQERFGQIISEIDDLLNELINMGESKSNIHTGWLLSFRATGMSSNRSSRGIYTSIPLDAITAAGLVKNADKYVDKWLDNGRV